jgi:DNA polymerase eta
VSIGFLQVVTVLSRAGVCERASIDEVYLDITEAAAARLLKEFPFTVESLSDEARKTHVLGLAEVHFWELNLL